MLIHLFFSRPPVVAISRARGASGSAWVRVTPDAAAFAERAPIPWHVQLDMACMVEWEARTALSVEWEARTALSVPANCVMPGDAMLMPRRISETGGLRQRPGTSAAFGGE